MWSCLGENPVFKHMQPRHKRYEASGIKLCYFTSMRRLPGWLDWVTKSVSHDLYSLASFIFPSNLIKWIQVWILRIQEPPLTLFRIGLGHVFSFGLHCMNTPVKCDTYKIDTCVTAMSSIRHNFGKRKVEWKPGITGWIYLPQNWILKNRWDVRFCWEDFSILFSYML